MITFQRDRHKVLEGKRILVVEDEYMIAHDIVHELEALGATVAGPCATVPRALKVLADGLPLDAAVLDVSLRDRLVYEVADRLIDRGVPVMFSTGFDAIAIPPRYQTVPRCEKPVPPGTVGALVADILAS